MISIFIMYSKDRRDALDYTITCLEQMPLYSECQKTLIIDGKADYIPDYWEILQVPRLNDKFCWGRMWDAGVATSNFEKIIYLDSDRLLPNNFLLLVNDLLEDDMFLFTSMHFMMTQTMPINICLDVLKHTNIAEMLRDERCLGNIRFEPRHEQPHHGPGKNVMSGSTAFTKKTYIESGGVDHWYCGHGAYADSDYHMQTSIKGCKFYDLNIPELHYPHFKEDKGIKLENEQLWLLGLDNFIYYCRKWNLPMILAESLAARSGVKKPKSYIQKREESMAISKE